MNKPIISISIPDLVTQKKLVALWKVLEKDISPDASKHNSDLEYLWLLITAIGDSQRGCAKRLGISERTFRDYLSMKHDSIAPYPVQYALERLAAAGIV